MSTEVQRAGAGDQVSLQVGASDADAEELATLASHLRDELLELDVERVDLLRAGPAPEGAKAVDVLALGGLIVTLAKSAGVAQVIRVVRGWLSRDSRREVEIQMDGDVLKLTGVTDDEQRRLVDAWIARHAGPADPG
jgi:hypothetical protein